MFSLCLFSLSYSLFSYTFFSEKYIQENLSYVPKNLSNSFPSDITIELSANMNPFSKKTKCVSDFENKKISIQVNALKIFNLRKEEKEAELIYGISQCSQEYILI